MLFLLRLRDGERGGWEMEKTESTVFVFYKPSSQRLRAVLH